MLCVARACGPDCRRRVSGRDGHEDKRAGGNDCDGQRAAPCSASVGSWFAASGPHAASTMQRCHRRSCRILERAGGALQPFGVRRTAVARPSGRWTCAVRRRQATPVGRGLP
jgi:hypothetical protein